MKKQSMIVAVVSILVLCSCKNSDDEVSPQYSNVNSATDSMGKSKGGNGGPPPPPEKVLADLDLDKDLLISRSEAKGPLAHDFEKVDSNKDNFISLEELKRGCPPPPKQEE